MRSWLEFTIQIVRNVSQSIKDFIDPLGRFKISKPHFMGRFTTHLPIFKLFEQKHIETLRSQFSSFHLLKKIQFAIAVVVVIFVFGAAVHFVRQIYALTLYFTQSDWSGGADTETTINSSNSTGWTKFYSKTAGIDETTSGEIKMKLETQP